MPFGGLLSVGLIGAGSSLFSGLFGASAASKASQAQVGAENNAIAEQQREFGITQANEQPFLSVGQTSIAQLMNSINNGTFGPGSLPNAPQFTGGDFKAPTLAEAQATPGYEFTAQQGNKGILQGAAAAGGAISGGTLRALDSFNTGLADSTYNDVFNRSLSTYNAGLSKYQAQLAGYGSTLAGQNQEFNQLISPAQIGSGSASTLASAGQASAQNIGQLMTGIGNAQASGTVGASNALTSGITGATNSATQAILLQKLLGSGVSPSVGIGSGSPFDPNYQSPYGAGAIQIPGT